jgi:valyl-tRNA synthetase
MSKTRGNVIDPREVMDDFGTDALRFTLLTAGTPATT